MKKLIFPILIPLFIWSCSSSQKAPSPVNSKIIQNDSSEYEIIIIDSDFENWYLMHYSPAKDYSNEFYRSRNQVGVSNWNDYFMRGKYHHFIDTQIFYDNSIDYGIDVNRRLYWYFKYAEDKLGIRLLQ